MFHVYNLDMASINYCVCFWEKYGQTDHSDEGFILMERLYWTDLDTVLSLHVLEECPYVLQGLFGAIALQPTM